MTITHTDILKIYPGNGGWYFVVVPAEKVSSDIQRGGWGSIKIKCRLGNTEWETSMFYTKQMDGYFLPVKKSVRLAEEVVEGDKIVIDIFVK
jgi:hypothetical protein